MSTCSDAARKTLVAVRGWATRASRKLSLIIRDVAITCIELNFEVEKLDKRLNALDEAQLAVEQEIDVEYLEADIDEAAQSPCPGRHMARYHCQPNNDRLPQRHGCLNWSCL